MRAALALTGFTALALALASASSAEGAGAARPRVALSVAPAELALIAPSSRRLKVRNDGAERVVVDVTRRAVGPQPAAKAWLQIAPARLSLSSGESRVLTLRVRRPRGAEPGDHPVLVLLTTRPLRGGGINVQARLGVRIKMRVPGRIVRRLTLGGVRVRRARTTRHLLVPVANRGNVTLQLRGQVTVALFRRGRQLTRLSPVVRRLLQPGARTVVVLRYRGRTRGLVTAVVRVRLDSRIPVVERRYRLRL